jgi:16S rRNA (guanine966-N2)-methyltransferase
MVRITGGQLRGRRLDVPAGARPTTELARKAAFDILGARVAGASVLDACAGSGAYGLEALSRGAVHVTFVERDRKIGRVLRGNTEAVGAKEQATIEIRPVASYAALAGAGLSPARFDLIFHDPPFEVSSEEDLALLLGLLAEDGALVHERGDDHVPELPGIRPPDVRRYGRTRLLFFRR